MGTCNLPVALRIILFQAKSQRAIEVTGIIFFLKKMLLEGGILDFSRLSFP
jgi:hypothetical protein